MKIAFYLPSIVTHPVGGYKIVYEYANRLAERGDEVTIIYDFSDKGKNRAYLPYFLRMILVRGLAWYNLIKNPRWFPLSAAVRQHCIFNVSDEVIGHYDAIVATAYTTARKVAGLQNIKNKLYLIQGYEVWNGRTNEEVETSYKLGMKNIVICKWLKKIVDNATGNTDSNLIPNGIDFQVFGVDVPIEERDPYSVSMLYHRGEHKGSKYGIEVLKRLKDIYPNLKAHLFGVPSRPSALPEWMEYTQKATQKQLRDIYNKSAMFLCPTINEGFGLTGAESMACGCAMVSTDYGGVHEYATPDEDVILSPVRDVEAMVSNFITLIENQEERIRLAVNGNRNIKRLDWDKSVEIFQSIL